MPRWAALVLLTSACGGSTPQPKHEVKPPSQCDRVADHEIGLMSASQKAAPEQLDPFRRIIAHHCTDDGWSVDMQNCLLATKTIAEGNACERLLTPQQAQALERDGEAAAQNVGAGSGE